MSQTAQIVICGAGITGTAAAYFLSRAGVNDILLVDERPPLSLTSDRSTECYRNWWPDPSMTAFMNRSIDLMEQMAEESGNIFKLNHRGYLYVIGDESKIPALIDRSRAISNQGGGELRIHDTPSKDIYTFNPFEGWKGQPAGADLLIGSEMIRKHYPCLTLQAVAALHVRRAGWLSAQQLGMHMLESARNRGVRFVSDVVTGVNVHGNRVQAVILGSGEIVHTPKFVNAAGPFFRRVGRMVGLDLPVYSELHMKAMIKDVIGVVPRDAPLLVWDDVQSLPWSDEELESLAEDGSSQWLCESFPSGVHTRPEGGVESQTILMLWEYKKRVVEPTWPPAMDNTFPEIVLRGLAALLPGMKEYFSRIPQPQVDGGYYTKTPENRPMIGDTEVEGAYLIGAVSGFGIMSACAAGELLAEYITGLPLPGYAHAFSPLRYRDPDYLRKYTQFPGDGQL